MVSVAELTDRDLCLALAKALGWLEHHGTGEMCIPGRSANGYGCEPPGWLLTPAGAFAVLAAMRARGAGVAIADREQDRWCAYIYMRSGHEGDVTYVNLARAIAEAAYVALEGES